MKLKLYHQTEIALNVLKGKILLKDERLYKIIDFVIIEVNEPQGKTFWGKALPLKKVRYLTNINILTYNTRGKYFGHAADDYCEDLIVWYDLLSLHEQWNNLVEQINAFGYKLTNNDLLEQAFEAGREYQEYKGNTNLEEKSWDYTFSKWCEKNNIK